MTNKLTIFIFFLLFFYAAISAQPDKAAAQETITLEEGFAVPMSHSYTREAVFRDIIQWQLINDEFETPEENNILHITAAGDTLKWEKVSIQEDGRFSGHELRAGYLYLNFHSDEEKVMWLNADGHNMAYVNGVPRAGDIYAYGYMNLPIKVKEGKNELLLRSARWGGIQAKLITPEFDIGFLEDDLTLPHIISGEQEPLWGALRVVNSTDEPFEGAEIKSSISGHEIVTPIPAVPPMSVRKVPFQFDPSGAHPNYEITNVDLELVADNNTIHETSLQVSVVQPRAHHSRTFISKIDGSIQYFSVAPQQSVAEHGALFLSVHGAEVEAISQARAYEPKEWGTLVAPTNRRPRGFNWEDWGRMDALEVLEIAKEKYQPDPQRIYLTGHSMGGHGTWYLGATYPDHWAAIAPAAGYPSLRGYGSHDGRIPDREESSAERMLTRSANPSDVMNLIPNYSAHGVYILHGDADRVVSVEHARTMRNELGQFHPDFVYYEYPGGTHWYGNESVDWPPLFQFFKDREIPHPTDPDEIQFITPNPGISHSFRWAAIEQQTEALKMSRFELNRDVEESEITGTTDNVDRLTLNLEPFNPGESVTIKLDDTPALPITINNDKTVTLARTSDGWQQAGKLSADQKGPHRHGAFKEAFTNNMIFVYGTSGTEKENRLAYEKARYDAETWYYRGNGAVDVIPDGKFDTGQYPERNVIIYGNRDVNSAWGDLLPDCPIQITRHFVEMGNHRIEGEDLAAYFLYPRPDSDTASVAVIAGTGTEGMMAASGNQYFAGGSGFPDFMIFQSDMLLHGADSVLSIGFFDNNWKTDPMQTVLQLRSN